MRDVDPSKTLDELDPPAWGDPTYSSSVVRECHRLRRVPLGDLTPGDLRLMIGQSLSLELLLPLAIRTVEQEPLCCGTYFEGDLLLVLLRVPDALWRTRPEALSCVLAVLHALVVIPEELDDAVFGFLERWDAEWGGGLFT